MNLLPELPPDEQARVEQLCDADARDRRRTVRYARVYVNNSGTPTAEQVARYLPSNYQVTGKDSEGHILIQGEDYAGWTLDGYIIPRLGSGIIVARETTEDGEHYHEGG